MSTGTPTKNVVITGASTGIGQTCALHLDNLGWRVFAGVRKQADADTLQARASSQLTPIFIDVTQPDTIAAAANTVTQAVNGSGLAGLVNNAGIAIGGPLEFLPIENLRQQLEINVIGQVAVTQAFLPLLRLARGRVVNMSSISGRIAMPFFGPYSASKFALEALSDSLRRELYPWGIDVICIEPGAIDTPIWEKGLSRGEEIAANLPAEGRQLYDPILNNLRETVLDTAGRGIPSQAVAKVVTHALSAKRPKTRYIVGKDAKLAAFVIKLLPDRWRDRLILRVGKM